MNRNLFIVSTPLQLLCATEARDRFHAGEDNRLAVVRTPLRSGVAVEQFHQVLKRLIDDGWSEQWYPRIGKKQQTFFAQTAAWFIRSVGSVHTIYTATFQTPQCHLINSINHRELVVIDDGLGVHTVLKRYRNSPKSRPWRHRLLGIRSAWPSDPDLKVFSSFEVDWQASHLQRNDYRCFRKRIGQGLERRSREIVIISEPTERAFGIRIDYEQLVENLRMVMEFDEVRIINHPNDTSPPAGGSRLPGPLETFALTEGYLPAVFLGFMSSAMITLRHIYQCPVACLQISEQDIHRDREDRLQDYYPEFRRHGISMIPSEAWSGTNEATNAIPSRDRLVPIVSRPDF